MADTGRRMTDAEFRRLRAKIKDVYREAYEDIYKKNLDFVKRHERREAQYRQMMDEGKITKTDFDMWMRGQVFQGKQWEAKRKQMEATLLNADQMAMDMINGSRVRVFADNANFIGYELEQHGRVDTSFGLYDINSVKRLLMEEPDLLPPRSVGKDESYKWYNKQIQGAVTQGIIQGEKLTDIAKRIGQLTGERCMNAMLRNARTMHTGAENAGRIEGMHQAQRLGIDVQKKWLATLDGHTRDAHRDLDGQVRDVDKPFDSSMGKIRFPGDATAFPGLVWNCRCTLTYVYPKYPDSMTQRRDNITGEVIEDMTYREWERMKREEEPEPEKRPKGEQPELTQFNRYDPETRSAEQKLAQVNPNYSQGGDWAVNCQRTVVAQELVYRGYDVTAKPRDMSDPIKSSGVACWKFKTKEWWKDPDVIVPGMRSNFKSSIKSAFDQWGDGARAIVRVKWNKRYGGSGHFFTARYENGRIIYEDPQTNQEIDIGDTLKKCTTSRNALWIMRVDNREVTDNVKYAVKNREDKNG